MKQTSHSNALSKRQFIGAVGAFALSPTLLMAQTPGVIKLIIPYGPGGPTDVVARLVSTQLQTILKQTVIVENKPGAGSAIGARFVANSTADGRTILIGNVSTYAIAPATMKNPGYDPVKSFAPIVQTSDICSVMVTGTSFPANTVQEFVTYARANPGKISYGSAGIGSTPHLTGDHVLRVLGKLDAIHIPFQGAAPALNATMANQVQLASVALPPAVPLIKSGKLKALAVTSLKRLDALPNVPTVSESGFSDFEDYTWVGLFAPTKLPNDLLNRLNGLINEAVRQPDFRDKLNAAGFEAQTGSPQYFNDYLKLELTKWGKIVKETGVSPQ